MHDKSNNEIETVKMEVADWGRTSKSKSCFSIGLEKFACSKLDPLNHGCPRTEVSLFQAGPHLRKGHEAEANWCWSLTQAQEHGRKCNLQCTAFRSQEWNQDRVWIWKFGSFTRCSDGCWLVSNSGCNSEIWVNIRLRPLWFSMCCSHVSHTQVISLMCNWKQMSLIMTLKLSWDWISLNKCEESCRSSESGLGANCKKLLYWQIRWGNSETHIS